MKRALLALAVTAALGWQTPAHAATGPRAFLERLYAHYPTPPGGGAFDAWDDQAPAWLDPQLVRLLRESARLGSPDEVGPLDYDAFCQCQDAAGLRVRIVAVRSRGPGRAAADVALDFAPPDQGSSQHIRIELVRVGGGWRVHDVAAKDRPSLVAYLRAENARRRR